MQAPRRPLLPGHNAGHTAGHTAGLAGTRQSPAQPDSEKLPQGGATVPSGELSVAVLATLLSRKCLLPRHAHETVTRCKGSVEDKDGQECLGQPTLLSTRSP